MPKNKLKDKLTDILIDGFENSPHKIVYEPKYEGELYVVSANYKKMIAKVVDRIMDLFKKEPDDSQRT